MSFSGRIIVNIIIAFTLTIGVIFLVSGHDLFLKWPWFKYSLIFSIISLLVSYTVIVDHLLRHNLEDKFNNYASSIYVVLFIPLLHLLFAPHYSILGLKSGGDQIFILFGTMFIHGALSAKIANVLHLAIKDKLTNDRQT